MIVYLLGYMGSGKTKTGHLLSRKLGYDFIDTDSLIENSEQKSVSAIFQESGEDIFRELEQRILREVSHKTNCIVSTGGGMPCFFDNMDLMNKTGMTVYLKLPEGMLVQRLFNDKNKRPLLMDLDEDQLRLKVKEQIQEREVYYNKARLVFNASNMDVSLLAEQIANYSIK